MTHNRIGPWRTATRSQSNGDACVQARVNDGLPQVSDSQFPPDMPKPILDVDVDAWAGLLDFVRTSR